MPHRAKTILVSLGILFVILVSMVAMKTTSVGAASYVSGHVQCESGAGVEGVWIAANSGGSGWASWYSYANYGEPNYASFSYNLPYGGSYYVHVGCGGIPSHWQVPTYSYNAVTGSGHTFYCWDYQYEDRYYPHCTNS
jgi:hypothetical protein